LIAMSAVHWRERWIAWRNRLLRDPRFQAWAAGFPLTRPIVRQRTDALFDLVAGFVYSQVLDSCIRLELLERLADGPLDIAAVAEKTDLPVQSAERLLIAASALGLVDRLCPRRFALGPQGAALLGNAGLRDMVAHHRLLYADLADSVGLLRRGGGQGGLAAYWPYATTAKASEADAQAVGAYSRLMAATQPAVAAEILHAYDLRRHRCLMDVGGGEGAFLEAAGRHAPHLKLMLFDLPAVTERARERLGAAELLERARLEGGDFLHDPVPEGADLVTIIRILHDHDDAGVATLLRSVRRALPRDGAVLIAEPMSRAPRPDPVSDAYFGLYLLAMGRGRARTPAEIEGFLSAAGFTRLRRLPTRTPSLLGLILARP
jgi:demethylspheroidene O-methyltransferase